MSGGDSSRVIRQRVVRAREIQSARFENTTGVYSNSDLTPKMMESFCSLNNDCKQLLKHSMDKLNLSARAYDRIIKVSRTIADLDETQNIESWHVAEAINYRSLDKYSWGEGR